MKPGYSISIRYCRLFSACLILMSTFHQVLAQSDPLKSVRQSFEEYHKKALQEKIYTHTDKQFYVAGEILWFKIYDVDGTFHFPLDISKVAYVEIINEAQMPELQIKVAMDKGTGNGSVFLPLTLSSGNYRLRVYTNWMKNFPTDGYFEKVITIVNTQEPITSMAEKEVPDYTAQFFPEGGHLVNGIPCTLGFRILDNNTGKGINCKGMILDEKGDTIASFQPLKFGIGRCAFSPDAAHTYKAVITPDNGKRFVQELPVIDKEGFVMQVSDSSNDKIKVTVIANQLSGTPPTGQVYLFIHTRQDIKGTDLAELQNGHAVFLVDKKVLGDGISHMTVFNSTKQPVCERLYFKRPENQLIISAQPEHGQYGQRTKVNIPVVTKNKSGKSVSADMSIAVYLLDSLQKAPRENIFNYLWLSSDLQGAIESPAYYFSDDEQVVQALDNLMLTHGWRKFRWENVLQHKAPLFKYVPEHNGHIITGNVIDTKTGKPVHKMFLTHLSAPDKWWYYYPAYSDDNGRVMYYTKGLYDTKELVLQVGMGKDSTHSINIDNPFSTLPAIDSMPPFIMPASLSGELEAHSVGMQVMRTYSQDQMKKTTPPLGDTIPFYRQYDWRFLLDDYTRFTTMEEVLREYVVSVVIRRVNGKMNINLNRSIGQPRNEYFDFQPLMLYDGVPIFNSEALIALDPIKVKKIEIVNRLYYYGPTISYGIISLTTYSGNLDGLKLNPNMIILDYEGLQLRREFYSPTYNTQAEKESTLPDLRSLLYWAPVVKTSDTDSTQVSFYTGDQPGKYIVVVEGMTQDGQAGSQQFVFDIINE